MSDFRAVVKLHLSRNQIKQSCQMDYFIGKFSTKILYRIVDDSIEISLSSTVFCKMATIYHLQPTLTYSQQIFLLNEIINLKSYQECGHIEQYTILYPVSDFKTITNYYNSYFENFFKTKTQLPLLEIANIFGTENAFYFDLTSTIMNILWYLLPFSVVTFAASFWYGIDNIYSALYSFLVTFVFIIFIQYWNQRVNIRNYEWQSSSQLHQHAIEPMYTANVLNSTVSTQYLGSTVFILKPWSLFTQICAYLIQIPLFGLLIACNVVNIALGNVITQYLSFMPYIVTDIIVSVIYSTVLILLDKIFYFLVVKSTKYENHLFYSTFRNSTAVKYCIVNTVNTFGYWLYSIYVLRISPSKLVVMLITQFGIKEILYRQLTQCLKLRRGNNSSVQLDLYYYIANYQLVITMMIYMLMFSWVFPVGTILVLLNIYLEIKMDLQDYIGGHLKVPKLCYNNGIWTLIMQQSIQIAITVNNLFFIYYSSLFNGMSTEKKLILFVIFQQGLMMFRGILPYWIEDTPLRLKLLLRKDFKRNKSLIECDC